MARRIAAAAAALSLLLLAFAAAGVGAAHGRPSRGGASAARPRNTLLARRSAAAMTVGERPPAARPPASARQLNIPPHVRRVLDDPRAPKREAEHEARTTRIRARAQRAMDDARAIVGGTAASDEAAWWVAPLADVPVGGRPVSAAAPLRVLVAGGGLAGLIVAAACHAKGMKVALFEQAASYAPYGGPIQIQSNALRALRQIDARLFDELVAAGTVTADRVSGLKIGYAAGNALAGRYDKGDWLVRFDTVGPALEAGLPPTVVVDRPVIQQIFVRHGFPAETVRIKSRVARYERLGEVRACARAAEASRACVGGREGGREGGRGRWLGAGARNGAQCDRTEGRESERPKLSASCGVDAPPLSCVCMCVRVRMCARVRACAQGQGVKVTLEDGTEAFGDVLVGADGIWSSVRKQMFKLGEVRAARRRRRRGYARGVHGRAGVCCARLLPSSAATRSPPPPSPHLSAHAHARAHVRTSQPFS
jgi:hypothetical protein